MRRNDTTLSVSDSEVAERCREFRDSQDTTVTAALSTLIDEVADTEVTK